MFFRGGGLAKVYKCFEMATKDPVAPPASAWITRVVDFQILSVSHVLYN
jgi:hypothetical protein